MGQIDELERLDLEEYPALSEASAGNGIQVLMKTAGPPLFTESDLWFGEVVKHSAKLEKLKADISAALLN